MSPETDTTPAPGSLTERLTELAFGEAARTRAYPGLDGAIRHERRVRRLRSGSLATAAAVVVAALAVPLTPVRVAPLDEIAARIGLRDRDPGGRSQKAPSPIQPEVAFDRRFADSEGAPLPAPRGAAVADRAWRDAAGQQARKLVVPHGGFLDGRHPAVMWSADDGTTVRVVVGFLGKEEGSHPTWAVLAAPSGSAPDQLTLSSTGPMLTPRDPSAGAFEPGLVARVTAPGWDAPKMEVSGLPTVSADGVMTTIWHRMAQVEKGLWIGDLGVEAAAGHEFRPGIEDAGDERPWSVNPKNPWQAEPSSPDPVERALSTSSLSKVADRGYAGAGVDVSWAGTPTVNDGEGASGHADVRLFGVRSSGGGWLVTGDVVPPGPPAGPTDRPSDEALSLDLVPAPATRDGGTPFAAVRLAGSSAQPATYLLVWAPPTVVSARTGRVTAPVRSGVAVLDVRSGGGERYAPGTEGQHFLVQGLDRDGNVVARTWVAVPDTRSPDEFD